MSSLSERAGQMFVIGFEGDEFNRPMENLLRAVRPGGVIFFQRNIATEDQFQVLVREVTAALHRHNAVSPFLAMDLEGGLVDRLREVVSPLPSARDAARAGLARELGRMAGRELAAFALNVDFAPVLDLASPESGVVLASRSASGSPQEVARFAEDFLDGLGEQGVLGCGKHFPGLGSGQQDSHLVMPRIDKTEAELWEADLYPFRVLAARLPMIMVAHAAYPGLQQDTSSPKTVRPVPATLSRNVVSSLLRERVGFEGVIVCDDLEMGGVLEGRSIGEAALEAALAGCDVLPVCRYAENVERAFEAVVQEAERSSAFRSRVTEAAGRVAATKRKFLQPQLAPAAHFSDWDGLRREIRELAEAVDRRESEPRPLGSG